jgi:hypothetical protein
MFDQNITHAEYMYVSNARANLVRQLLIEALQDQVPAGYVLSIDPDRMYGNALLALRPIQPTACQKMVCFIHAINYRSCVGDGHVTCRPTVESVRACGDEKGPVHWEKDETFGVDGRVEITSAAAVDLPAMVGFIAAQVCSFAPFTAFEWRRCAHDDGGRWELYDGDRHLQSVWKSGSRYGTLMGTCPTTLAAAKAEAEAAARFAICCEHQERLVGLGQQLEDTDPQAEEDAADTPSM